MKNTVDDLVRWLNSPRSDLVYRHIAVLDSIDSRFSQVAIRLFTESQSEPSERYVRSMLNKRVEDKRAFDDALARVKFVKSHFGAHYNAARLVLDDAICAQSIATMGMDVYSVYPVIMAASSGDFHLVPTNTIARPDMMTATSSELNDYFRPIAVAGILLGVNEDEQRFIAEAPAFLTWVAAQPNMDEVLAAALQAKSLDPNTIKDIVDMQRSTPTALHSGLI